MRIRYEGLQYTDADIADFETRLARIYRREVHRVQVFDFGELPDLMAEGLSTRMLIEHRDAQGQILRRYRLLDSVHTGPKARDIPHKGDPRARGRSPSYTSIRDLILRLCHRLIACSIARRSQAPEKAWEALGLERHPDPTTGAPEATDDAPIVDEGS
ncbi:hypothetical protein Tco_0813803 [Tanacetum coccineum]